MIVVESALDLVLNALWHDLTVLLSAGLGIECPLALQQVLLSAGLGIECPLVLPHGPVFSWTWY